MSADTSGTVPGLRDLYVYYRVAPGNAAVLQRQVAAMQQWLRREYGIVASLKRRPGEKDGRQTWMEVYPAVGDGFEALLETAVERAGAAVLIDGPRHAEIFMDIAQCA